MENTENKEIQKIKFKLIATLASLLICFCIVGVTVFAVITQTATVNDNITISSDVQAAVKVEQKFGDPDRVLLTASDYTLVTKNEVGSVYSTVVNKTGTEATASGTGLNPNFSYTNGYTYTAYKITISNESTLYSASYTIALNNFLTGGDASQITLYYADGTAMATSAVLTGTVASGASTVVYVVIAVNVPMADLVPVTTKSYTLTVNVTKTP